MSGDPEEEELPAPPPPEEPQRETVSPTVTAADTAPTGGYIKEALSRVLSGDSDGFREIARARGLLPDTLCEEINEALFDEFGDTVVFADGNRYLPVPDYTEDITEWMKK